MAKGDNYVLNNREELEKVLAQYGNKLVGFINCYVNNVAAAEDLMMDVFVAVLQRQPVFADEHARRSYLYKCAKNKALNYLKKNRRLTLLNEELLADTYALENELYYNHTRKLLIETIKPLKHAYRTVLYLSLLAEMDNAEICDTMGLNERQLRNLKHRAKKQLNNRLKQKNLYFK